MTDDPVIRQLKVAMSALREIRDTVSNSDPLWYPKRARAALQGIRMIDCEIDITPRMIAAAGRVLRADLDPSSHVTDEEIKSALCAALATKED